MMEKVLDFDEWFGKNKNLIPFGTIESMESFFKTVWHSARQGMIPADRAVEVPEVSEWPDWAIGVRLVFEETGMWRDSGYPGGQTVRQVQNTWFPRPTPQWSPKIGEAVFYRKNDGEIGVGTAHKHFDLPERWYVTQLDGTTYVVWEKDMKSFHPEAIGLSWGEI
jgi:hypothetical protein